MSFDPRIDPNAERRARTWMLVGLAMTCMWPISSSVRRTERSEAPAPVASPNGSMEMAQAATMPRRPAPPAPPAPAELQERLAELGRAFNGRAGIAVRDMETGWTAAWDGDNLYPQQSVSKLWVAVAVMDAVDRGELSLSDPVTIRPHDLSVFNQPIRHLVKGPEGYTTTVARLLNDAITKSDNAANDALMRRVGGADAVEAVLARKGLTGVRLGAEERYLQTAIAGLNWSPNLLDPDQFEAARDRLPRPQRLAARDIYLSDPMDGAKPTALVEGLARLAQGELLSPASSAYLIGVMERTRTGPMRLGGGLPGDWKMAHKTGTGQDLAGETIGYNDIGVLTAPDGRRYAVAVMIAKTGLPQDKRRQLMHAVSRAVVATHAGEAS